MSVATLHFGRKPRKNKDSAVPIDFIERVNKMDKNQLVLSFIQEENDILGLDKQRKTDSSLSDINKQIRERETVLKEQIDVLKDQIKAIRDEDSELVSLKEDKKALMGGYRDEKKRRKAQRDYLYKTMLKAFPG